MKYSRTLVVLMLGLFMQSAVAAEQTASIMHKVYDAIAYLLPPRMPTALWKKTATSTTNIWPNKLTRA